MRISTTQFYFQNSQQISNKQSEVNQQIEHLSSNKRILTAKDDAVGYGTLLGYKDELSKIDKYQRNITTSENRNSLQETAFSSAESALRSLNTIFIQANNGAQSDQDLQAITQQVDNTFAQLLDIANTKDDTGGYIFSGFQTGNQPFTRLPDNSVTYSGDNGVRELQIGNNVFVDLNQPGNKAFLDIKNPIGDFSANYNTNTSGVSVNSAQIKDRGNYNTTANPPNYTFNFTSATNLTVTDSLGNNVFTTTSYAPGQTIAFNGVEVQLNGNPLPGDNFDLVPEENISVFETIKSAINWLNQGTNPANLEQHRVDYDEIKERITNALNHMTSKQSVAGVNRQLISNQKNNHTDTELVIEKGRSSIEDLDFAKAITEFESSKAALQAAQQSFVQIRNLSLFNFI